MVTEAASAGSDTVVATVNYTLPASNTVEVLNMLGAGLTGTGSDGAETLISSGGPNTLIGLGGNDTITSQHRRRGDRGANGGSDTWPRASITRCRPTHVEVLYMLGSGLTGTGSAAPKRCSAAADPTRWSGLAAMISITSTTPTTW